jgi:two-component system sensor histidine kinase KdpD
MDTLWRSSTRAARQRWPGPWWLVLLGSLAGQAAHVAEADRGRAALLAAVSHDLRTPLAAAKAAVSCLRSGEIPFTAEDRDELLATAEESLDQLTQLAASLLDVSRLQAGAQAVFPRPADLGEMRIVDHGPGIPDADRERVFLPFCRLGEVGSRTSVGLGLVVSRGLAEAMGGTVEPEETPGGGLTMVVSLRAAPARPIAEIGGASRIRAA